MVRRKHLATDLANHLMPQSGQKMGTYLGHMPNYQNMLAWQAQMQLHARPPQQQGLTSSARKLSSCMPRMARPEVNSRLQRPPWPPEVINVPHPSMMRHYEAAPEPPPAVMPMWCDYNVNDSQRQQRAPSNISLVVQQQLQDLKVQQQLLLWQQEDQQRQQQHQRQLQHELQQLQAKPFVPFNFGICAGNVIESITPSESILYAATHPKEMTTVKPPTTHIIRRVNQSKVPEQAKDVNYIKVTRQLVKPAVVRSAAPQEHAAGSNQDISKTFSQATVKAMSDNEASTITLTSKVEEQRAERSGGTTEKGLPGLCAAEHELDSLATDIDVNLCAIRRLLAAEKLVSKRSEVESLTSILSTKDSNLSDKSSVNLNQKEIILSAAELELLERMLREQERTESSKTPTETISETESAKSETLKSLAQSRILNLTKLFQSKKFEDIESDALWKTLMHLVKRMCVNEESGGQDLNGLGRMKAGSGMPQAKSPGIYLMITPDDENGTENATQFKEQVVLARQHGDYMEVSPMCSYNQMNYLPMNYAPLYNANYQLKQHQHQQQQQHQQSQQQQQQPSKQQQPARKKKCNSARRRHIVEPTNPSMPLRRPLHWPKPDLSKPAVPPKPKKLQRRTSRTAARLRYGRYSEPDNRWLDAYPPSILSHNKNPYNPLTPYLVKRSPKLPLQNNLS